MFTGIVEELGEIVTIEQGADSAVLRVRGPLVVSDATHGASIASTASASPSSSTTPRASASTSWPRR